MARPRPYCLCVLAAGPRLVGWRGARRHKAAFTRRPINFVICDARTDKTGRRDGGGAMRQGYGCLPIPAPEQRGSPIKA